MKNPIISNAKSLGINPLTREENEVLYARIRQGDKSAINEMIEGNIAFVIVTVANYVRQHPTFKYMQDDLQSSCYVALVEAVNCFADADGFLDNPMGYLYQAFRNDIENVVWSVDAFGPSKYLTTHSLGCEGVARPRRVNKDVAKLEVCDHTPLINLRLLINMCCIDDIDVSIVNYANRATRTLKSAYGST